MNLRVISLIGVSIVLIMSLYQCGTSSKTAKTPTAAPAANKLSVLAVAQRRWPDATVESLKAGQVIYNTKCTRCHDAKEIADYSEAEWLPIIDKMSTKANLADSSKEIVKRYILTEVDYLAASK